MSRKYKYINYRTGIATEVILGDLTFYLVARSRDDLAAAFARVTDGKAVFNSDLAQKIKLSRVRQTTA